MYKRILVPLDGSEFAESALSHALALATCSGAEIVLLRVAVHPRYEYIAPDPLLVESMRADPTIESAAYLERKANELRESGCRVTAETCTRPLAETILDYAEGIGADLIVMSTHGHSGLARWFIGSTADKVVRGARLPVMLARPASLGS
jgi:nucleotide-binding universal stress UspA family protein